LAAGAETSTVIYETEVISTAATTTINELEKNFFRCLDQELNKVNQFFCAKEREFAERAQMLNRQLLNLARITQAYQYQHDQRHRHDPDHAATAALSPSITCCIIAPRSASTPHAPAPYDHHKLLLSRLVLKLRLYLRNATFTAALRSLVTSASNFPALFGSTVDNHHHHHHHAAAPSKFGASQHRYFLFPLAKTLRIKIE
jgi:hypothetical protein